MKTKKRRNKRNNLNLKNYNFNQKNFVEKIYNKDNDFWELSLILSKEKLLNIIKLFSQNNENNFILETKKIITEIKNNNINLSAKYFDDNAIDAFAYTILKNISKYCDLFLNLGINQKIMINLYIENNMFIKDDKKLFQVIGEKTEEEIKIEPYSSDKYDIKGLKDYAEKIVLNENKKIIFKYQKDDHIIIILENHFAKLLLENILYKKYEDFKDWFIREIKFYITETNYFFNSIIPKIPEFEKIANVLFEEKDYYNILANKNWEKIIFKINLKSNDNKILEFQNYNSIIDNDIENIFVEKIYNKDNDFWTLSLILAKKIWEQIVRIFINNGKNNFIGHIP